MATVELVMTGTLPGWGRIYRSALEETFMAKPKRTPKVKRKRLTTAERVERRAREMLGQLFNEKMPHYLRQEIQREMELLVARGVISRLAHDELHKMWVGQLQAHVDRRVVDVVRSLRLRFSVKDSDQLFDAGGR